MRGLAEFREHLGGDLTITLLAAIGRGIEVHAIDEGLMVSSDRLAQGAIGIMRLPGRLGQLTYCTNIHRGESWAEIWNVLRTDLLAVKTIVAPRESFGVGLRLSGLAVRGRRASRP